MPLLSKGNTLTSALYIVLESETGVGPRVLSPAALIPGLSISGGLLSRIVVGPYTTVAYGGPGKIRDSNGGLRHRFSLDYLVRKTLGFSN